jgi:bifunctional DNA-binding transcriptional regulator/antitoxin component of YhaV-PrlF toxin-antitoxin module
MKNVYTILFAAISIGVVGCNQTTINPPLAIQTVAGKISAMTADRSSITVAGQNIKLVSVAPASQSSVQTRFYWKGHVKVNDSSASVNALSVGQSVSVTKSGDEASEVQVKLEVKGAISSIGTNSLVVAGKTVLVDSSTRFDLSGDDDHAPSSVRTLADLKAGDFVEVTGATDAATGNVLASKIEVKTASELSEDGEDDDSEIKGTIAGLSADTFTLGTVTVHCVSPCALPIGLKNGDFVEAEGRLTGSNLEAKKVKFEDDLEDHPAAGSSIVLSDDVNHLNATSFDLGRYSVDYSTASVTGTLANKALVKVEGKVDASNTKLVHATTVTVLASAGGTDGGGHK